MEKNQSITVKSLLDSQNVWIEEWRVIAGFTGLYEVSNWGRVKSLTRYIKHSRGGEKIHHGRIMKQKFDGCGYLQVQLYKPDSKLFYRVSRLVALSFIPNIESKKTVNHKNGIKEDNRVENLEWATYSENAKHSFRELGRKPNKTMLNNFGCDHNRSRRITQYNKHGEYINTFGGLLETERITGIGHQNISSVANGRRKSAGGFIWKYAEQQ